MFYYIWSRYNVTEIKLQKLATILKKVYAILNVFEMNLFAVSCLIIILPLFSQIVLGSILALRRVKRNFDLLSILNIVFQVITIIIAIKIIENESQNAGVRCGMPQAAMLFLGLISVIALIVVIVIQILIRKYRKRKVF